MTNDEVLAAVVAQLVGAGCSVPAEQIHLDLEKPVGAALRTALDRYHRYAFHEDETVKPQVRVAVSRRPEGFLVRIGVTGRSEALVTVTYRL